MLMGRGNSNVLYDSTVVRLRPEAGLKFWLVPAEKSAVKIKVTDKLLRYLEAHGQVPSSLGLERRLRGTRQILTTHMMGYKGGSWCYEKEKNNLLRVLDSNGLLILDHRWFLAHQGSQWKQNITVTPEYCELVNLELDPEAIKTLAS